MKKNYRIFTVIALYVACFIIYILFFILGIDNIPLFLFLTIGSVAILSTSTIYTVVQSKESQDYRIRDKKLIKKPKSMKQKIDNTIEDYLNAMPSLEEYINSDDSYEEMPVINKYIFSIFSQEELEKINLLALSKMDKILFIREMLYYDADERRNLIDNMLRSKDKTDKEILYTPPKSTIGMEDQIRVYVRSLIEPGEKTKIIIIDNMDLISEIKNRIGVLFYYDMHNFLLSSGGIILNENLLIKDYDIDDDDEIALIPSRKDKN